MNDCYAVLLDTVSIQEYIFSSNRLRENLGASHLVKEIYRTYLNCALYTITGSTIDLDAWESAESEMPCDSEPVEIGYVGGGNALLFFQDEELAQKFIEEWTKILLVHAPGLTTAVACSPFPKDLQKFPGSLKALFTKLRQNKAQHSPITALPRHGITAECARSGVSAEIYNVLVEAYVSASTNARIRAASSSKEELEGKYRSELADRFCFTDELDKLGRIRGEDSHIAIVHIDGNDIGKRFKEASTLKAIRQLSKTVRLATEAAFKAIIAEAVEQYDNIMQSLGFDPDRYPKTDGKNILPIRSIVLGGDDVTFVCDGKLGIYFAKIFIEAFERGRASDSGKLTACAGVAIIQTKYPFYRGVALANELCTNAKKKRKDARSQDSFLDFHVSLGGVAGKLTELRESYFQVPQGSLLYRPFKVVPKDEKSLDLFLSKVWQIQSNLPNSQINRLREVLTFPEEATRKFVQELKWRKRRLPEIEGHQYAETLFEDGLTPYSDMVEILRFYPEFALQENGEKA